MEEDVFPHPAVSRILTAKFVEARLHTDHETLGEKWIEIERGYIGYSAQSMYLIVDPNEPSKLLRSTNYDLKYKGDPQLFADWLEGK